VDDGQRTPRAAEKSHCWKRVLILNEFLLNGLRIFALANSAASSVALAQAATVALDPVLHLLQSANHSFPRTDLLPTACFTTGVASAASGAVSSDSRAAKIQQGH